MGSRTRRHTTPRRSDTSDPSRSRERALRVLFQSDLRGVEPTVTLGRLDADPDARSLLDERDSLTDETPIVPLPGPEEGAPAGETVSGSGRGASSGAERGRPRPDAAATPTGTPEQPAGTKEQLGPTPEQPTGTTEQLGPTPEQPTGSPEQPTGTSRGPAGTSSGWTDAPKGAPAPELDGFTRTLVRGVEEHRQEVETLITRYSRRWAISRMPVVDRNVLRLATYELLHEPTPPAVVIDEAVDLAKRLSTDDSGRFVNGVLESIRKDIAEVQRAPTEPEV